MRRCALVLTFALAAAVGVRAAEPLQGNWRLVQIGAASESTVAIIKAEMKDGKPCGAVVFSRPNVEATVSSFTVTDTGVTLALKQTQTIQQRNQQRKFESTLEFVGVRGS